MRAAADMTERHGRILAELAEIGLTIARDLQAQALQAETPEAKAQAVAAFPRVARAVRQSLALEAKLQRDARREANEVRGEAARDLGLRLRRRKALVRTYMQRAIANDTPDDDDRIHMRLEDLRDRLDDDLLDAAFAERPVEDILADLHIELGLQLPDFGLDEPDEAPDPDDGADHDGDPPAPPDAPPPKPTPDPDFRYSSG